MVARRGRVGGGLSHFTSDGICFRYPVYAGSVSVRNGDLVYERKRYFSVSECKCMGLLLGSSPGAGCDGQSFSGQRRVLRCNVCSIILRGVVRFVSSAPSVEGVLSINYNRNFCTERVRREARQGVFTFSLSGRTVRVTSGGSGHGTIG